MAKVQLGPKEIRALLPHRYPMLLVDRVLEVSETDVVGEKMVTNNEPFFQGHFPDHPIMPGVLIIEAMAQIAGLLVCYNEPAARERGLVLAGVNRARFRRPVLPGSVLALHVTQLRRRRGIFVVEGIARVEGDTVAEAELIAALVDWEQTE